MAVEIYKIIKTTSGRFHSWVKTNIGIIRKPNNKIKMAKTSKRIWFPKIVDTITDEEAQSWYIKIWELIKKALNWLNSIFK